MLTASCQRCHAQVPLGATFCGACGSRLAQAPVDPTTRLTPPPVPAGPTFSTQAPPIDPCASQYPVGPALSSPPQPSSQPYPPQLPYGQVYPPRFPAQPMTAATDPLVRRRRRIAFSRGVIFGLVMGLVVALWVAYSIVPQIPAFIPAGPLVSLLQALPAWVIYYFAGRSGAKAGRKVSTGVLTCLWATGWYLLLDLIGFIVIAVYYRYVPDFGGFSLDFALALIGVGIGWFGANSSALPAAAPPYPPAQQ